MIGGKQQWAFTPCDYHCICECGCAYSQHIMTLLAVEYGHIRADDGADLAWAEGGRLLARFRKSDFDKDDVSEQDAMIAWLEWLPPAPRFR